MNIQQIKDEYTCLDYLDTPVKKVTNGYLARCPWREDTHPSLSITPNGKGWHDLATGEHGNLIDMVMRCLGTTDLRRVCAEFEQLQPRSFSFPLSNSLDLGKEKSNTFASFAVMSLQSPGLFAYLSQRGVKIGIAKQFLQEAHYTFVERDDGKYFYALAFANDKGGYELRTAPYTGNPDGYKGGTSPKAITTHLPLAGAPIIVFEGFFDMLSFATLCDGVKHNYLTLNSVVNVPSAIDFLRDYKAKVFLCLDNDDSGNEATATLQKAFPAAIDLRRRFFPSKDVNDYLCKKAQQS